MDKGLLDYIKSLTKQDSKGLLGKALKTSEEAGELAKKVLPFENQAGTLHRFVDRESILEECVDTYLCVQSIAYDLGFSDDDFESMVRRKASDWHELQVKESKIEFPIPYEIHVTILIDANGAVDHTNYVSHQITLFKLACKDLGVKPIIIDLETNGQVVMQDVMTSSHFFGNNSEAYEESQRIKGFLLSHGFDVTRVKIETVPWHPAAPQKHGDKMPEDCYFEAHIGCIIDDSQKERLSSYVSQYEKLHLSRNPFKKLENGKFVNMITLRIDDVCFEIFKDWLEKTCADLDLMGIEYEKIISEFAIYDTKVHHDFIWTNKEKTEA